MDLTLSPSEQQFRDEVRTWLEENHPGPEPEAGLEEVMAFRREWQRKLHEAGWAGISWPKEYGGRGATLIEQAIFVGEAARQEAPSPANVLGLAMGGPVVIAHGTDEQKQRYLEPILTAEEIWCQGFSEPESGSDLASLKTRAVKDGDEWVVTGQKVWTTFAQYAKWCMLVARTDPDAPKHKGLTYFLMDMDQPGVEAKPLVQITGEGEFNEVFIEEARIPDANVVGGVGNGWSVAITTLMNERAGLAFGAIAQIANSLKRLAELAGETRVNGGTAAEDPFFRAADRPAPHRGRDDAAQRLPRPDQDDAVGHSRARRARSASGSGPTSTSASPSWRSTSRAPTRRSTAAPSTRSPTAPGSTASCARAPTRSRAAPPTSSRTSSPSGCSACRGCAR